MVGLLRIALAIDRQGKSCLCLSQKTDRSNSSKAREVRGSSEELSVMSKNVKVASGKVLNRAVAVKFTNPHIKPSKLIYCQPVWWSHITLVTTSLREQLVLKAYDCISFIMETLNGDAGLVKLRCGFTGIVVDR